MATFHYMTVAVGEYENPRFEFSDRLRKVRRDVAQMTQEQMAAELGVTRKAYEAWESGRNIPGDIVAVAKRIAMRWRGVTAAWVLGVDDESPIPPGPSGGVETQLPDQQNGDPTTGLRIIRAKDAA